MLYYLFSTQGVIEYPNNSMLSYSQRDLFPELAYLDLGWLVEGKIKCGSTTWACLSTFISYLSKIEKWLDNALLYN